MRFDFINNTWDIAHEHWHNAFMLLSEVYKLECLYENNQAWIPKYGSTEWWNSQHLKKLSENHILSKNLFRKYSGSILFFQAMMESLINDAYENILNPHSTKFNEEILQTLHNKTEYKNLSFESKWENFLKKLNIDSSDFKKYKINIYKPYRNLIAHPELQKRDSNISDLNNLTFEILYNGFFAGWKAYKDLYEALGLPHLEYKDKTSWEIMCETYNIPVFKKLTLI